MSREVWVSERGPELLNLPKHSRVIPYPEPPQDEPDEDDDGLTSA